MSLGARIFPALEANLSSGWDIESWLGAGLLDFVVPNVYTEMPVDPGFPFEWLLDLAAPSGCQVYPALGVSGGTVETYRATAASYWHRGAHGLYLPWFAWPVETDGRRILTDIGDPETLAGQSKTYVVAGTQDACVKRGYRGQLPLELGVKADGQVRRLDLYIVNDTETTNARLRLLVRDLSARDQFAVTVNGNALAADGIQMTADDYLTSWLEVAVPPGLLRTGDNEIGLRLLARAPKLISNVVVQEAEILLSHD